MERVAWTQKQLELEQGSIQELGLGLGSLCLVRHDTIQVNKTIN